MAGVPASSMLAGPVVNRMPMSPSSDVLAAWNAEAGIEISSVLKYTAEQCECFSASFTHDVTSAAQGIDGKLSERAIVVHNTLIEVLSVSYFREKSDSLIFVL